MTLGFITIMVNLVFGLGSYDSTINIPDQVSRSLMFNLIVDIDISISFIIFSFA